MSENLNHHYSKKEENLNIWSHALGLVASIIVFPFLLLKAFSYLGFWQITSFIIYGFSLIILYVASTFYHAAKEPKKRRKLNIFDHAAIYVLIAGSYTPFCLVALNSNLGWYMFIAVWLFALTGVILKLFFTGRFDKISTAMYLLMGWQIMFFIKPLISALSSYNLKLLIAGGVFYTIGAVLYSIRKLPYNHAIFHVFVLLGSLSHFLAIYNL
ncbi:PAQR family membrane homeostasis protein TrhA [Polaribacter sargassicola]|uniref:PAQR family membrane homeostasis protein TrhA n=1 Tax=Polaribacter sargassicola TaxID=2836891 RepID=UPI001F3A61FD|nr:hemolysin III family protein [Polaribacter sp. DS7-9]MCG1035288.1 hemolysin III family protein [Polaribacter sp. DS7-9]